MPPKVKRTRTTAEATQEGLRLFIAGIPWHIDEEILWRDFGECGELEDLFLLKDPNGSSKGKCFATFRDAAGAQAALAYNETEYGGRTLYVKVAEEKTKPPKQEEVKPKSKKERRTLDKPEEKPEGCTSLCLKNIGSASEGDLRSMLKDCQLQSVRLVYSRDTGEPRGIAFVDFTSTEDVDKAMAMNCKLEGQPVLMSYEVPKLKPRPEGCLSVVVKPLDKNITDEEIHSLFQAQAKSIKEVRVLRNKAKECMGLAFVDFTKAAAVEAAVKLNGTGWWQSSASATGDAPQPDACESARASSGTNASSTTWQHPASNAAGNDKSNPRLQETESSREPGRRSSDVKRAQSAPPTPSVPARRDKWWLGVDAETRKKYAEEMREWLIGIDPTFSQYFAIVEENYDTVDQICRLYKLEHKGCDPEISLDPLFFDDNNISNPAHRDLFQGWFSRKWGIKSPKKEIPKAQTNGVERSEKTSAATNGSNGATSIVSSSRLPQPQEDAPVQVAPEPPQSAVTPQGGWDSSSGWKNGWSSTWSGSANWWDNKPEGAPLQEKPWDSSGWSNWKTGSKWS